MFAIRAVTASQAGACPVPSASPGLSTVPGTQQVTQRALVVRDSDFHIGEKIRKILHGCKTTACYSMVALSKTLSQGNDESSSTQTVRRLGRAPQEAAVVRWQASELRDQTDFASNRAFLRVTWGTRFWVSLNLGFVIFKM